MTNVPHILAIPERQVRAPARQALAAHLGPHAAQRHCARFLPRGTFSMALL